MSEFWHMLVVQLYDNDNDNDRLSIHTSMNHSLLQMSNKSACASTLSTPSLMLE
jgi:hypothetical protein